VPINGRRFGPRALLGAAALVYLGATTPYLSSFPLVGQDEPWIAAAPIKLATEGVLGNDLFAGYYGMDRHHLQHMPVFPVLEAGVFKLLGVGVWQMRTLSVAFGLALLLATYLVGAQIGGEGIGALAALLLVTLRLTAGDAETGILLLDRARINRYDIAVPVFGLFAVWTFLRARRPRGLLLAGGLAGLASLTHLYGALWWPFLWLLAAVGGEPAEYRRAVTSVSAGFLLAWLPWLAYVVPLWSDYLGQLKPIGARFSFLSPRFYSENLLYGDGPLSLTWGVRTLESLPAAHIGAWATVAALTAAAVAVPLAIRRHELSAPAAATLLFALWLQPLVFAALLSVKTVNYMIAVWPPLVLALAWTGTWIWHRSRPAVQFALAIVLMLTIAEGVDRIGHVVQAAGEVMPYDFYTSEIAGCIPPAARVVGFQHYFLGLRQYEYRSWLLVVDMARPGWYGEPLTFAEALRRVNPSVLLVDRYFTAFLESNQTSDRPYYADVAGLRQFMTERDADLTCAIKDRSYGTMLVYRLRG